ncbi:hypothetical protein [Umezawaea beigongshangensis]|uniref:hypothetical protein n=1 Tax=Umezawaea beigongshangensis TaxID=2780383 RepID=UPI0018F198D7|nr:hypothetical protein [Umezawaea beigongshangensis]
MAAASAVMGLGPIAAVGTHGVNDRPWAVEVTHRSSAGTLLLVIKTVRSSHGLSPRGLPVENAESQLLDFLSRTRDRGSGLVVPVRGSSVANHDRVRAAVAEASVVPVEVVIDHGLVPGTRIDALGAVVIRVGWKDQTVLLTGAADHLGTLELHTATSSDVDHLHV